MKKLILALSIVLLFAACDNDGMNNDNGKNEHGYLTISYHSEGHTSGEVPEDSKYPIIATGYTMEKDFVEPYGAAFRVYGQGTLERDGFSFLGWQMKNPSNPDFMYGPDFIYGGEDYYFKIVDEPFWDGKLYFLDDGDKYFEFHAGWKQN